MVFFRNMVLIAAVAGGLAGLCMTVAQEFTTVPLILQAETFEGQSGAPAHSHAHGDAAEVSGHSHGDGTAGVEEEGWAPADGFERTFFTLLANIVTGVGFALLLVAVSELFGGIADWRQGVFWGLAGFAIFTLAPGLGLPPELPAMPAAELGARQLWWVGTVVSTAIALGLMFYSRSVYAVAGAVVLLLLPHLIGAPQPVSHESPIPEGLHHSFVVAAVLTTLVFWVLLGGLAGLFRERFLRAA
ncbi:MAG: CbtA family protein [Methyloceanibacter sp.]|uniref:CbtA family protein n=1 Tax=Methyloceanibacter sp. TaxID=1965321 RepID=UPI003D9B72F2